MPGDARQPLIVLPADCDYIERVAADTLAHCEAAARAPSDCLFVVNHAAMVAPLRDCLIALQLDRQPALLGPRILPYRVWLQEASGIGIEPRSIQELHLLDILHEFPHYFDRDKSWQYCDNLLALFEALQQAGTDVDSCDPRHTGSAWARLQGLSKEQRTVELLYHHWLKEPLGARFADVVKAAYRNQAQAAQMVVFAGFDELSRFDSELLTAILQRTGGLAFFSEYDRPANQVIRELTESQFPVRTQQDWVSEHGTGTASSPGSVHDQIAANWQVDAAVDEEHEAQLTVGRITGHDLADAASIGVVSENRRLLRRIRALLDMRGIPTRDYAGWPLATVSAATLPQRLLDCVESHFYYKSLVDLLRSPYLSVPTADGEPGGHRLAELLESQIVARGGVRNGLASYLARIEHHLADGADASGRWLSLQTNLARIDAATADLQRAHDADRATACQFATALRQALEALDAWQWLDDDPAGALIVRLISMLERRSADTPSRTLTWRELRTWFRRALEEQNFVPPDPPQPTARVRLMSLREAVCLQFDTLFVVGANDQYLPGNPQGLTRFFNERTCERLGIRPRRYFRELALWRLRALLRRSRRVFISYACEEGSELLQPGGWMPASSVARGVARAASPFDYGAIYARDVHPRERERVARTTAQPCVTLGEVRLPARISASSHQRLVDCPYLFYTGNVLGIRAPHEARERLEKSDYGNLVHRCLQRFHDQPDSEALIATDPQAAIERLTAISQRVFANDVADNFEHRGWQQRWQRCIKDYVRWQLQRAGDYQVLESEVTRSRQLDRELAIHGKLDRVDRVVQSGRSAVIDYKTGQAGRSADIEAGEDVQLITYALLEDDPGEVAYLKLDGGRARPTGVLTGEALARTREAVGDRLLATFAAMRAGRALPAWKNSRCRVCDMSGVCRTGWWQ